MALFTLAKPSLKKHPIWMARLLPVAILGASLFYGDAVLTPAISVLSAVEGLEVGTSAFKPYIVPLAAGILVAIFLIQARGTRSIGVWFGPVCALWFIAIGTGGLWNVAGNPAICTRSSQYALPFVTAHGAASFLVLGSVLLAVTVPRLCTRTGAFRQAPDPDCVVRTRSAPLVFHYFGPGAVLMTSPSARQSVLFRFPSWALYHGRARHCSNHHRLAGDDFRAYSITNPAIHSATARMNIRHTSDQTIWQIYIPVVNWILLSVVFLAIVGFGPRPRLRPLMWWAVMAPCSHHMPCIFVCASFGTIALAGARNYRGPGRLESTSLRPRSSK